MSRPRALPALPGTPASRRLQHLGRKRPGPRTQRAGGGRTRSSARRAYPAWCRLVPARSSVSFLLGCREPPPQPATRASKRAGPPGGGDEPQGQMARRTVSEDQPGEEVETIGCELSISAPNPWVPHRTASRPSPFRLQFGKSVFAQPPSGSSVYSLGGLPGLCPLPRCCDVQTSGFALTKALVYSSVPQTPHFSVPKRI